MWPALWPPTLDWEFSGLVYYCGFLLRCVSDRSTPTKINATPRKAATTPQPPPKLMVTFHHTKAKTSVTKITTIEAMMISLVCSFRTGSSGKSLPVGAAYKNSNGTSQLRRPKRTPTVAPPPPPIFHPTTPETRQMLSAATAKMVASSD